MGEKAEWVITVSIIFSSHLVHVWLALTATQLFVAGGEFADEVVAAETRQKVQIDRGWGKGNKKWKSKY